MTKLSWTDMNSLNAIACFLRCARYDKMAEVLLEIQFKASKMLREREGLFKFSKTVNVTNDKNILVQVPRAVARDWNLKIGDTLEVTYNGNTLTVSPSVQGRGDTTRQSD